MNSPGQYNFNLLWGIQAFVHIYEILFLLCDAAPAGASKVHSHLLSHWALVTC